ncbi:excise, DNA binding domain, excisionase family [uncultured Caudovirales phage]|uniref:Excise, DNA binding domain, excisionase family n=1 Tax=uncultured Caudovirales phage TaxID=2100421 RepID=A0A6J5STQ2_9CAUD|nr:excise, DNA binding domain, excisionase family [uncultured Caudovirales phage]
MGERLTMTVQETADALGISRNTAYDLVHQGVIPSVRLGRRFLVPKQALKDWLNQSERTTHEHHR